MKKPNQDTVAVVLAAGQGTRMKSDKAKVLHEILGVPMGVYPVISCLEAGASKVVVVIGHQAERVRDAITGHLPEDAPVEFVRQEEQLGTGHAVLMAAAATQDASTIFVTYGDVPGLPASTISRMFGMFIDGGGGLLMSTFVVDDPTGYGRVLRDDTGRVLGIIEHKEASYEQRAIRECNAGIYVMERDPAMWMLKENFARLEEGECYLTDLAEGFVRQGRRVNAYGFEDPCEFEGVNTRRQLAGVASTIRARILEKWMDLGATFADPVTTFVGPHVKIGADAVIGAGVHLRGNTVIGSGATIDAGCVLDEATVADGDTLNPYTLISNARG